MQLYVFVVAWLRCLVFLLFSLFIRSIFLDVYDWLVGDGHSCLVGSADCWSCGASGFDAADGALEASQSRVVA